MDVCCLVVIWCVSWSSVQNNVSESVLLVKKLQRQGQSNL